MMLPAIVQAICFNLEDFFLTAKTKDEIEAAAEQISTYMKSLATRVPNPVDQQAMTDAVQEFQKKIAQK